MSCVYCEPKSRMRIFSEWMSTLPPAPMELGPGPGRGPGPRLDLEVDRPDPSIGSVIRRFLLDDDVVDVALAKAGRRDPDEARLLAELLDGLAAEVAHAAAQPARELEERHLHRPLVRDAPLDPLGHELVG